MLTVRSNRGISCVVGAALYCLSLQTPARAQAPDTKPQMADDVFKNVKVLRGIPAQEFMETMGFFSAALGANCTFCHVGESGGDWAKYADDTIPQKTTARRMVTMVAAMNKMYFGDRRVLTCYSCHRGGERPKVIPNLDDLYGPPLLETSDDFLEQTPKSISAGQILDKYIQALGGAQTLAAISSYAVKGTYQAYDTSKQPLEIYANRPAQRTMIIHTPNGDSRSGYDGRTGWVAALATESPLPNVLLSGSALDGARLDAEMAIPGAIKQSFTEWRVGFPTTIDDKDVLVLQGSGNGRSPARFYFDKQSGLLVRLVRYSNSSVGLSPTRFDYSDYREVAGVKLPHKWTITWLDGRSTIELNDVQVNVPVEPGIFSRPPAR